MIVVIHKANEKLIFKNCALLTSCISENKFTQC